MAMPRLSRPLEQRRDQYTVVVVGSGYGGAITASRLARAGQAVCLLERGRELHPGDFPRTAAEAERQLHLADGPRHVGDQRNLFTFHIGADMNVLTGCGLGGTSLINANVSLRPLERVLDDPLWPAALRADRAGLVAGYERAEEMLQPETYPASYPPLHKVEALQRSAAGAPFRLTPINVTFRAGVNPVGVHQDACNGCGDCVTGCNFGAKNTLLMNYLPDAVAHGAEVFTEVDVRSVERVGDGWAVWFQPLGSGRAGFRPPPQAVRADLVVIAAGTLGSNEILLRSAANGLTVSGRVGHRFTGNGDMLGYSYGVAGEVNGTGMGSHATDPADPPGPCITAVIDDRDRPDPLDDVIIEDAVIPGALAPMVPAMLAPQVLPRWLRGGIRRGAGPLALLQSALTRGRRGSLRKMQTFLLMGADDDEGQVVLDRDAVRVLWPGAGTRPFYERADLSLRRAAEAAGGDYLDSPVYDKAFRHRVMTVHPLGGCVMADTAEHGVVDHQGRVFSGPSGAEVHRGLHVSDGSVVPTAARRQPAADHLGPGRAHGGPHRGRAWLDHRLRARRPGTGERCAADASDQARPAVLREDVRLVLAGRRRRGRSGPPGPGCLPRRGGGGRSGGVTPDVRAHALDRRRSRRDRALGRTDERRRQRERTGALA